MTLSGLSMIALALLLVLLGLAVEGDIRHGRIRNWLVIAGLLLGALFQLAAVISGQPTLAGAGPWDWLAGALVGGAVLLPLYLLRACGAGDVKLMAAIGAITGMHVAFSAALYTMVAGGLLSLAVMALRGVTGQTLSNVRHLLTDRGLRATAGQRLRIAPLAHTAARLPYAVAIAAGTLAALLQPLPLLE